MLLQKLFYISCFFSVVILFSITSGCIKEYSYEGETRDSTRNIDSVPTPDTIDNTTTIIFPCSACKPASALNLQEWSFKVGNTYTCGKTTGAVLSPDGDAMTFFGPTFCTEDTGIVVTAFFGELSLKRDQSNITASRSSIEYYEKSTPGNVMESSNRFGFYVTITKYEQQSKLAEGTFKGVVLAKDGSQINIEDGKFKIKFR